MPNVSFIKVLADMAVAAKQHKMPPKDSWQDPSDKESKDNYKKGVGDKNQGPGYPAADGIMTYFATQSMHKIHKQIADDMTKAYKDLIGAQLDAVQFGFNMYKMLLGFQNLKINGPTVVGSKGCLKANGQFKNFFDMAPSHIKFMSYKNYPKWKDAVGKGVEKCIKKYVDGVTVTGFPWYPAFAAFPGPVAPPMPNVTWPLIACPSSGLADLTTPDKLKKAMLNEFDSGLADKCNDKIHETIFEAIATALAPGFLIWISTSMINLVMGTGNIPTFAPPWVPVGPVVNGQNLPGMHLLT